MMLPMAGMRFMSECSGIEAASVAWHPLGWQAVAYSEIDPFACAVLAHHYPLTPNFGDMTRFKEWPDAAIDLLVGGTPCQSFSVAGLRKGLDDPRGNLMLTYLAIAARYRPRWVVWENVPGVLSSNGGRDFGALLGGMAKLGYGFAYRVLDAQFFGLAQRRGRVFVVGCLGSWQRAAAVLFERASLRGDPAPSREAGQEVASPIASGSRRSSGYRLDADTATNLIAFGGNNTSGPIDVATACTAEGGSGRMDFETETFIAFDTTQITSPANHSSPKSGDACHPLTAGGHPPAIAFDSRQDPVHGEIAGALGSSGSQAQAVAITGGIAQAMKVRRLTPRECERLMGFPDDYTLITTKAARKVEADMLAYLRASYPNMSEEEARREAADGPRYKAIGNSMAVPVMAWIGRRIGQVDAIPAIRSAT